MTDLAALADGIEDRQRSFEASIRAVSSAGPVVSSAGGPGQGLSDYAQRLVRHSEQYKHNIGWVYTAITRIATRLSGQPIHMGRILGAVQSERVRELVRKHGHRRVNAAWRKARGTRLLPPWQRAKAPDYVKAAPYEYEIVEEHPFLKALKRPNEIPWFTASSLFSVTVSSLEITGLTYWWVPIIQGEQRIYPIPSDWATPLHTKTEMYVNFEVRPPGKFEDPEIVPPEEMICFAFADPSDPHKTVSPMQAQAPAIAADEAIQASQARQFKNDMFPGLLIRMARKPGIDGKPGPRMIPQRWQRKRIIEALRAMYEGVTNYREPLILDGMIEDVDRLTYDPTEMDYMNSGKVTKARIMQGYGVNPFVAGENTTVGWGQASVAEGAFLANVVNPLSVMLGESISKHTDIDGHVLWFEEAVPRNPELKLKAYTVGLNSKAGPMAIVTEEEFRQEILHLPPKEEDEEEEPEPEDEEPVDEDLDDEPEEPPKKPVPEEEGSRQYAPPSSKVYASWSRAITSLKILRPQQLEAHEHDMAKALQGFFGKVAESVLDNLRVVDTSVQPSPSMVDLLFRPVDWQDGLREAALEPITRAVRDGYLTAKQLMDRRLSEIKVTWRELRKDLLAASPEEISAIVDWELPETVEAGIRGAVNTALEQDYWQKILKTTGDQVGKTLATAGAEQWTRHQLKKQIMLDVGDETGKRSKMIARSEMTGMMNAGHQVQAEELGGLGLHPVKVWVTIGDLVVRESHGWMAGQEAVGEEGLFMVSGYDVPFPGHWTLPAEERCNCRCSFLTDLQELRGMGLGTEYVPPEPPSRPQAVPKPIPAAQTPVVEPAPIVALPPAQAPTPAPAPKPLAGNEGPIQRAAVDARLDETADQIRDMERERLVVLNRDGTIHYAEDGLKHQVRLTSDQLAEMKGRISLHNHPGNTTFSGDDIAGAITRGDAEMHVVGKSGNRYKMSFEGIDDLSPAGRATMAAEIGADFTKKVREKASQVVAKIRSGEIPLGHRPTTEQIMDAAWKDVAKERGLTYTGL